MYNQELYDRMLKEFGEIGMLSFSIKVSRMYEILYEDYFNRKVEGFTSYGFDKEWWKEKAVELEKKLNF